ncbi:MAG: SulP family inorganic anion transporter, partial [Candidatus Omnitrophota bacterium]
ETIPVDFIDKCLVFARNVGSINYTAVSLALATILICVIWPKVSRKVPGALIAILATSALVGIFKIPVETIYSRFGELPKAIPMPHMPMLDMNTMRVLFQPALTIAILGSIESLMSAVVSDGMIGGKHRSNTELIGQGIANIGSALFGGMPATGAIARTVTNIRNGGRTPVAGIVHALTVLIIIVLFGRFIGMVPLACLAGILVVIAYNMSEWRSFKELLSGSMGGKAVLLATFFTTVFIDLPSAIELGLILSAFLFMKRMSDVTTVKIFAKEIGDDEKNGDQLSQTIPVPPGVQVYEINGPLFFAAANSFEETDRVVNKKPKVRILRFRDVPIIDSTGMYALRMFYDRCKKSGIHLIITGLHVQPLNEMVKSNLYELVGEDNVAASMKESVEKAKKYLA